MIQRIKTLFLTAALVLGIMTPLAVPAVVSAAPIDDACAGLSAAGGDANCNKQTATDKFSSIIKQVINVLSILVGAISVIMIIVGGLRYVLSNGDSNALGGAKNTILYAIIGLVVALFAQAIVKFVLTTVS